MAYQIEGSNIQLNFEREIEKIDHEIIELQSKSNTEMKLNEKRKLFINIFLKKKEYFMLLNEMEPTDHAQKQITTCQKWVDNAKICINPSWECCHEKNICNHF